jgi:hypothetical protein
MTVETHHDAQEWVRGDLDDDFYRGVWHERICTRCHKQQALFQHQLYSWFPGDHRPAHEFKPDEYFRLPGDDW